MCIRDSLTCVRLYLLAEGVGGQFPACLLYTSTPTAPTAKPARENKEVKAENTAKPADPDDIYATLGTRAVSYTHLLHSFVTLRSLLTVRLR